MLPQDKTIRQKIALQILLLFRAAQFGTTVIVIFVTSFLAWSHSFHYCTYYPSYCSRKDYVKIPGGLVTILCSCVAIIIESYSTFALALFNQTPPSHSRLLKTSGTTLVVFAIGFYAYWTVPGVSDSFPICWMYSSYPWDRPEKYHCIITQSGVSWSIATLCITFLITAYAAIGLWMEKQGGRIRLEDGSACPAEEVESKGVGV